MIQVTILTIALAVPTIQITSEKAQLSSPDNYNPFTPQQEIDFINLASLDFQFNEMKEHSDIPTVNTFMTL